MDLLEATVYLFAIAVLLTVVYIIPYLLTAHSNRSKACGPRWLESTLKKGDARTLLFAPLETLETEECYSKATYSRNWWMDENQFQLERRAVFSKTWLFVTHASRFRKAGDYRTFEVAGFSFIVILGKDRQLRAFHNVCRHRAYAVTKKGCGSSTVLGCRYHGWSYDTKGKLIKAPEFDEVEGFDKDANGLWELKTEVRNSMVFVNLDAEAGTNGIGLSDSAKILKRWNLDAMQWIDGWKLDGKFNWKCSVGAFSPLDQKEGGNSFWSKIMDISKNDLESFEISICSTFIRLPSGSLVTIRLLPDSKSATAIECNMYSNKPSLSDVKGERESIEADIQFRVKELEFQQRKLLGSCAKSSSVQQDKINELVKSHLDCEARYGRTLHPAARNQGLTQDGQEDDDFCKALEKTTNGGPSMCGADGKKMLDW